MATQATQMRDGSCYTIYPRYAIDSRSTYAYSRGFRSVECYTGTFVREEGDDYLFDNVKFIQISINAINVSRSTTTKFNKTQYEFDINTDSGICNQAITTDGKSKRKSKKSTRKSKRRKSKRKSIRRKSL